MMEQEIGEQEPSEQEVTAPAASDTGQTSAAAQIYYADWTDTYKEARGYLYGTEEEEPDMEAAYEIMLEEAENGNALAMYDVAKMYKQGIHVEPGETAAAEWYQKSFQAFCYAERTAVKPKHHAYLEYRIGKMHQYGLGTEEDFGKAAEWFQRASDKNHKYAQYSLAMLYRQGKGVTQDDREAHRLFQRSHKQGNAYASYELAKMYEQGIGISVNPELATDCYRVAFLGFLGMAKRERMIPCCTASVPCICMEKERNRRKQRQYSILKSQQSMEMFMQSTSLPEFISNGKKKNWKQDNRRRKKSQTGNHMADGICRSGK